MTENYPSRFTPSECSNPAIKAIQEQSDHKLRVLSGERPALSQAMKDFYQANPNAPGSPHEPGTGDLEIDADVLGRQNASTKVHPQETTSLFEPKGTYRAQFMAGKHGEYAATVEALKAMCNKQAGSRIIALDNCRRFAHFAMDRASGDLRVMTDSCRQRWCPMCAGQKSKYAKESTRRWLDDLEMPKFLTLTLKHQEGELLPQLQFLQDAFRTLRQRVYWKRNVTGGIWFLQVHRSKHDGNWHPHLHVVLEGKYMVHGDLSELWDQVTYGSPVVHLVGIDDNEKAADYVARYAARPAKMEEQPIADRIEIMEALHGKRLSGTFGSAKCVTLTPPKIEDGPDWQFVASYDVVVSDSTTNKAAQALLDAWKLDKPAPMWAIKVYADKGKPKINLEPETKPDIQYLMDFFKSG